MKRHQKKNGVPPCCLRLLSRAPVASSMLSLKHLSQRKEHEEYFENTAYLKEDTEKDLHINTHRRAVPLGGRRSLIFDDDPF